MTKKVISRERGKRHGGNERIAGTAQDGEYHQHTNTNAM